MKTSLDKIIEEQAAYYGISLFKVRHEGMLPLPEVLNRYPAPLQFLMKQAVGK